MKKLSFKRTALLLFFALFLNSVAFAQQELQIHHINIENGDATMIAVYDKGTGHYLSKTLIDGGLSAASARLLPYIKKVAADTHFNYIILTHYHNDHYTGLNALGTGQLTADSLVDPGGYDFNQYFPGQQALTQLTGTKPAAMTVVPQWTRMLTKAVAGRYLKGRSQVFVSFGANGHSDLGRRIEIGRMAGLPVTLECVAGWGNTLTATGTSTDPLPDKENANNFSLAFVLRCGEFRYFIGGDLGGTNKKQYIDQEDLLTGYLAKDLPAVHTVAGDLKSGGHVCGLKADHHGSDNANNAAFIDAMFPAIAITSAGDQPNWMLPKEGYLGLLANAVPLSGNRGVYFTNLYDWHTGQQPLTKATSLFANKPGISFDYGNPPGHVYSYMVRVSSGHLDTESDFEVDRVDITLASPYLRLAVFQCHKK